MKVGGCLCISLSMKKVKEVINLCDTKDELGIILEELRDLFESENIEIYHGFWANLTRIVNEKVNEIEAQQSFQPDLR